MESPSIGPTSSTCTCNSPAGFGGRVRHHGSTHFQPTIALAPNKIMSTAIAHPHPRVARFISSSRSYLKRSKLIWRTIELVGNGSHLRHGIGLAAGVSSQSFLGSDRA